MQLSDMKTGELKEAAYDVREEFEKSKITLQILTQEINKRKQEADKVTVSKVEKPVVSNHVEKVDEASVATNVEKV